MPKKLFLIGGWICALLLAAAFLQPLRSKLPPDFLALYLGGKMAAAGQISRLYDPRAYQPFVEQLRASGVAMNERFDNHYFIRPAFQAFFYVPFTWLPYPEAARAAIAWNVLLLAMLVWKLPLWFQRPPFRMLLVCFLPFLWSIGIGQDTLLLALAAAYSLHLACQGKQTLAGLLLGVTVYKPHLIWAIPAALIASRKWKMLCSFLAVALSLAAAGAAAVGRSGLRQWLELVRAPSSDIWPDRMGNLRALGLHFGTASAVIAAVCALVCFAVVLRRGPFPAKFSSAIWTALLFSPHTYWQDYSLAAIPALAASGPAMRLLILLPWPYFYRGADELPAVALAIAWLGAAAVRLWLSRPAAASEDVSEPGPAAEPVGWKELPQP
jgi:hypothetical protein